MSTEITDRSVIGHHADGSPIYDDEIATTGALMRDITSGRYVRFDSLEDISESMTHAFTIEEGELAGVYAAKKHSHAADPVPVAGAYHAEIGSRASKHIGQFRGSAEVYKHISPHAYAGAAQRAQRKWGGDDAVDMEDMQFSGGCDSCKGKFVGAEDMDLSIIKEYSNTVNSRTKNQIVDELLEAGKRLGVPVTGESTEAKVKSMSAYLSSRNIGDKKEGLAKACVALARVINDIHGNNIIPLDGAPELICQQVAEILSSLNAGMHTEFLAVYSDVRRILKNLQILKKSLVDDNAQIMDRVRASSDTLLPQQMTTLNDLHKMITDEIDRQIAMLSNLLNVHLVPADKVLANLIKDKKDLHGYIEKIDIQFGKDGFGKVVGNILKGLGVTANFAQVIERALKTVGMTVDEYAKTESAQKLREKVVNGIMSNNMNEHDLHEYLNAAELLYKNLYRNQDIASAVNKTGSDEMYGGNIHDLIGESAFYGSADPSNDYPRTAMDKRIADRKSVKNLIFNTFYRQINSLFDNMVNALDTLSMKVGTEIPLSDPLNNLRQFMQRMNEELVRNKNIYYALIGYYNDSVAKSHKESLLADLRMISGAIDSVIELPMYSASKHYFLTVKEQISAIIALIDKFSDDIAQKFGRGEEPCPYMDDKTGAVEMYGGSIHDVMYGGSIHDIMGAADDFGFGATRNFELKPAVIYKTTKTIHDAIRKFDYNYRVAQIKFNLKASGKELDSYAEKYDKITATAIADVLEDEQKVYKKLREYIAGDKFGKPVEYVVPNATGFENPVDVEKEREAAQKFFDNMWDVKKRFWATVEAVDSYMRVFTNGLVNNPNDVKEIKSMLESVEIINDWYTDATGESLAGVFDHFPSFIQGDSLTSDGAFTRRQVVYPSDFDSKSNHYYGKIADNFNSVAPDAAKDMPTPEDVWRRALPGNPAIVTTPSKGFAALNAAKKTLSGLATLKNLLSVFVHIGSKFGGEDIRKKIFMSPTQMYNNIVDYLQTSAFTQGFGVGKPTDDKFADDSTIFASSENLAVEINLADGTPGAKSSSTGAGAHADPETCYPATGLIRVGVTQNKNAGFVSAPSAALPAGVPAAAPNKVLIFKKRWGVWMRSVMPGLKDMEGFSFDKEDEYFVLVMKSLAAKILTVTGLYDVFDRPMEYNGLSQIRMIIGGSSDMPKVEDGAVALYLRLPLLAQFYRGIFGFDNEDQSGENKFGVVDSWRARENNKNIKISMVPDVDGIFSGLIRLVFRKNKFIGSDLYADDDVKELIREVNLIYQRMQSKNPADVVMATIHEFIAEINRRYGVVSDHERDEYEREFGRRYDYAETGSTNRHDVMPETNYAILPGETDDEIVRPSPAERLMSESLSPLNERKRPFTVNTDHKGLVYRFRCAIDKYFEDANEDYTFNNAIKSCQMKLKREQSDDARFKLVSSLIRGVDVYSNVDSMKYVLFHETVVGGLNLLSSMHSMLARFKLRAHIIDLHMMEEYVWEYLAIKGVKTMEDMVSFIAGKLAALKLADAADLELVGTVRNLFGYCEALQVNGGQIAAYSAESAYTIKKTADVGDSPVYRLPTTDPKPGAGAGVFGTYDDGKITSDTRAAAGAAANCQGGLSSILLGKKVSDLKRAYKQGGTTDDAKIAQTFMRYIFSREWVMKELIESLFGLSSDFQGLVDVRLEDGRLLMNCGGLKTLVEEMFQHVNYFMDLLRPHIKPEIMEKYTSRRVPGSYYWLQEQIMEKIIVGRPEQTVADVGQNKGIGYASLDELMRKLTYTFERLTRPWSIDGGNLKASNPANTPGATMSTFKDATASKNSFDKVFAEMAFYDASKPLSGVVKSVSGDEEPKLVDYQYSPYDGLHFAGQPGAKTLDTRFAARFAQLYNWKDDEFTFNRSAMFAFNQLLAKFIQAFYDPTSNKMYNGLINGFANGAFNRAVTNYQNTYPDTVPLVHVRFTNPGEIKYPPSGTLANELSSDTQFEGYFVMFQQLLTQYAQYGIEPNQVAAKRAQLFNHANPELRIAVPDLNAGGAGPVNKTAPIYMYLLIHLIGKIISDIFDECINAGVTDADTQATTAHAQYTRQIVKILRIGRPTAAGAGFKGLKSKSTTFGAIKALYNAAAPRPSMQDIMNVLLEGGSAAIATRIIELSAHRSSTLASPNQGVSFQFPIAGTRLAYAIGSYALTTGGGGAMGAPVDPLGAYNIFKFKSYARFIYDVLRPANDIAIAGVQPIWTQGLQTTLANFPFATEMEDGRSDFPYRRDLFAYMQLRLAKAYNDAIISRATTLGDLYTKAANVIESSHKEYDAAIKAIKTVVTTSRSVYTPGKATQQPKYTIKQDDLINTVTDITKSVVSVPLTDSDYLLMARHEPVPEATMGANSIHKLGVTNKPGNTASDYAANLRKFGQRCDPDGEHILFSSLAAILRNMVSARLNTNQSLIYIQENIADVPLHIKEKMRANLPAFRNLFKELATRCEFIKKFLGQTSVDVKRDWSAAVGGAAPAHNPWPYVLNTPTTDSASTKNRFIGILDAVARGCVTLVASCEQTLREVGDDPKYFELYQGSIKDYKSQYGVDPFMPISSTLAVLKNTDATNCMNFFPIQALGQNAFKIMYGTRSIIGAPTTAVSMEHNPGFTQLIESFNILVDGKMQVDKVHAEAYLKTFVKMLRYVFELKHVKGIITPYVFDPVAEAAGPIPDLASAVAGILPYSGGLFTRGNLIVDAPAKLNALTLSSIVTNGNKKSFSIPAFSVTKPLEDTIKLTESSFKDEKIKELVQYLCDSDNKHPNLELQNIIDLGVVPINVHALMREIPLVNLYNYAYTFDRLIIELYYGLQNENAKKLMSELCGDYKTGNLRHITSAKDMLVALLLNPYLNVYGTNPALPGQPIVPTTKSSIDMFNDFVKPVMAGSANNGELGRPKFVSDQIFNKAIFGQLYPDKSSYSELGPIVPASSRGKIGNDDGVKMIAIIMTGLLTKLNTPFGAGPSKFSDNPAGAKLFVTGATSQAALMAMCAGAVKFLSARPSMSARAVYDNILSRWNGSNAGVWDPLRVPGNDDGRNKLATVVSIIAKLLYLPIANFVNDVNANGLAQNRISQCAREIVLMTMVLEHIGTVAVAAAPAGEYFGLAGPPADDAAALVAINAFLGGSPYKSDNSVKLTVADAAIRGLLNEGGFQWADVDASFTSMTFAKNLPSVLQSLVVDGKGLKMHTINIANIPNMLTTTDYIAALKDTLRPIGFSRNNQSTSLFSSSNKLTWIDTHTVAKDAAPTFGVGIQPDNKNVLDDNQVNVRDLPEDYAAIMATIGRFRFDTKFIRNLMFIVFLYRSIRVKLQRDLVYSKDIVLKAEPITRSSLTEFYGNQVDQGPEKLQNYRMSQRYSY